MPKGPQHPQRRASTANTEAVPAPVSTSVSADLPEIVLEWLPDASPNDADGVWVSLTPYLVDGSCSRGRSVEFDQFQSGTMSFTLESMDRTFDPDNTAGAYYGQLLPNKQVRLGLKWRGTTYPVFRGYVQSWGSTTVSDALFRTTVQCRDAFMRFEQIKLDSSPWAQTVPQTSPTAWFRLNETGTLRVSDSSGNGNYGLYDNATQGASSLIPGDSDGAASFAHLGGARVRIQNRNLITNYPFTVSAIIKVDATDPDGFKAIFSGWLPDYFLFGVKVVDAYGPSTLRAFISVGGTTHSEVTGVALDDNVAHHVVWAATSGGSWKLYVDGVLQATTIVDAGAPSWLTDQPAYWAIGNYADIPDYDLGFGSENEGTIDEFVVWNGTALDATTVAALHNASIGWDGDRTGVRAGRLLDAIGWPAALRDIATGIATLGYASWSAGASVLSVLQTWADSELGAFFISKDGHVTWRSRHYPLLDRRSTKSQATFGDAAGIRIAQDGLDLSRDSTLIRNPVQASRRNGISVTVRDDYLADQVYGNRDWSAPTSEENADATVYDRAWWMLQRFKDESLRLKAMTVDVRSQPEWWDTVLGLELGDRITITRTPLGIGSQIQVDQILEQIGWAFSKYEITSQFTGSPVDANVGEFLTLNDASNGLLDANVLAY